MGLPRDLLAALRLRRDILPKENPEPVGAGLTGVEVNKVCRSLYSRFIYRSTLPEWNDSYPSFEVFKKDMNDMVKATLDALKMNGFKVVRSEE